MTRPTDKVTLMFAGGGTGGHLFPAVAIAERVVEMLTPARTVDVHFVGTRRGIEFRLKEKLGYELHLIDIRGLVRSFTWRNLLLPFIIMRALRQATKLITRIKPDVVVGTGGYVAWPVLRQAAARKIPTVLQEQNSYPGITTRKLASQATHIYLGFEGARRHLPADCQVTVSGNPVRRAIVEGDRADAHRHFGLDPNKNTILILGGSQGARSINEAIMTSISSGNLPSGSQLLWQTGKLDHESICQRLGLDWSDGKAIAFTDRMDLAYAAADLAIARAGAITIAELQACTLPAILIPYPFAAGDHQRKNANEYASTGVAKVINQDDLEQTDILKLASEIFAENEITEMSTRLRAIQSDPDALDIIARGIIDLIDNQRSTGGSSDSRNSGQSGTC
ncbi:MAG: undecaprenyldiphospho-muramoylpentapeptide beta-N-acetylglucosaminyltransferase [candidate division Zixibacteria bacterium]